MVRKLTQTFVDERRASQVYEMEDSAVGESDLQSSEVDEHTKQLLQYQSSGFADAVQLNVKDKMPDQLFAGFWSQVEEHGDYNNAYLEKNEMEKETREQEAKCTRAERAKFKKPTVRQFMAIRHQGTA